MKKIVLLFVMMVSVVSLALAQRTVTGTVTDDDGGPLVGANVVVKGSNPLVGVSSDADGQYSIKVPSGYDVLTFSYLGFNTQEITLDASNVVDMVLSEGVALGETVVTALGISREEKSIGYSVTQVGGDKVTGSGEVNAIQGLAAKSSGVLVTGSAGTPGASSKITIRGASSLGGENQPLIVVDGVPYDNQTNASQGADYPFNANLNGVNNSNRALDINPDDIESISVLKGPAASALYGTRAASGVLIITTKKGKARKSGVNVSVSSSIDVSSINKLPEMQSAYGQGTGGGVLDGNGVPVAEGTYNGGTVQSWGPAVANSPSGRSFDNIGTFFGTGLSFNNSIAVSGGTEAARFRVSYSNATQNGIIPNTQLKRNTFRVSGDIGTDKLNFSGEIGYTNTLDKKSQQGSNLSGVMLSLTRMPADFDILGGPGANGYDNVDGSSFNYFPNYDNPLWSANNNSQNSVTNRITSRVTANYSPVSFLTFTARVSLDNYSDVRRQIFAKGARDATGDGEIWENPITHNEVNGDLIASFKKDFGKFSTSALIGYNLNHRKDRYIFSRGRDLTIPGFYNMSNATNLYASENTTTRRIAGAYFNIDLGYNSMIYLNIAGRQDYASTFGADLRKKGFFYPSVSLSFVFSELIPANDILSFGKIRASWASAGREPGEYQTTTYFNKPLIADGWTDGIGFPFLGQNGFAYSTLLGNQDLQPEVVSGIEIGLNLRFLSNRINLDFTYYSQTASKLILQRPIAPTSGFQFFAGNAGKMRNSGVELELGADIIKMEKFNWNLSANFTMNKNEVLALVEGVTELEPEVTFGDPAAYAIVGQAYGSLYGSMWERNSEGKVICDADGYPIIAATNGNIGNPFPDWTMGIRNTFTAFGFSLDFLLDIRQGGELWGGTVARLNRLGRSLASGNRNETYVVPNSVIEQLDGTFIANTMPLSARDYFTYAVGDFAATENAIYDASWVRLRELTLSYTLPKGIPLLQNATIFVTGRNLWLSTPYPGVDPETSLTGAGSNVGGFDWFNMPNTKSIIFGLRANF